MVMKKLFWWLPFGEVPEVSAADLLSLLERDPAPHILDVRTPREWTASRIEGSVNVPITSFRDALAGLGLDPERPIVAICLSAHRSIPAVRVLHEAGFTGARQLQGGMQAWWKAGLPVIEGQ